VERTTNSSQVHTAKFSPATKPSVGSGLLQRACACGQHTGGGECESCQQKGQALQRAAISPAPANDSVPPIVNDVLHGSGQPLEATTRAYLEPRFGHDFSSVRVHTDGQAAQSARAVNALAYTVGQNVVFGAGQYQPGTTSGNKLLAHELTHTIQQKSFGSSYVPQRATLISQPADPAETEADQVANQVLQSGKVNRSINAHEATIQKQDAPGAGSSSSPWSFSPLRKSYPSAGPKEKEVSTAETFCDIRSLCGFYTLQKIIPFDRVRDAYQKCYPEKKDSYLVCVAGSQFDPLSLSPEMALQAGKANSATAPSAQAGSGSGSSSSSSPFSKIADILHFKVNVGKGDIDFDLPSSVTATLPFKVGDAKTVAIKLAAASSKELSLSITYDGIPGAKLEGKGSVNLGDQSGKAELSVTSTRKVCKADTAEKIKADIQSAGDDLKKAVGELDKPIVPKSGSSSNELQTQVTRYAGVVKALVAIYQARDKTTAKCEDVPSMSVGLEGKLPSKDSKPDLKKPEPQGTYGGVFLRINW